MTESYEKSINQLNEIIGILNTVKNDSIVLKSLCSALHHVLLAIDNTNEAVLVANTNLSVLEEVCNAKCFTLSHISISLLIQIYRKIFIKAPGYAVRNVISSMLTILSNKASTNNARESSVGIIGELIGKRAFDCGSMLTDIVQTLLKLLKGSSDVPLRIACLKALNLVIIGGEFKLQDIHAEIIKTLVKIVLEKVIEIRQYSGILIDSIIKYSSGCTSVPAETLFAITSKGLEDENPVVQDIYCHAVSSIYMELINAYIDAQEKAKIGNARGDVSSSPNTAAIKKQSSMSRLSITKFVTSSKKPVVEEYTFRSVVTILIKHIIKPANPLRVSYLAVLGYLISESIYTVDPASDYEWLITSFTSIFKEAAIMNLSHEDKIFFRSRISHIIRNSIINNLTEALQLVFASQLTQFIAGVEQHHEDELQFVLNELGHMIKILGEFVGSIADEIQIALSIHLRHMCFGVRSATANVFASLAHTAPALAASYISNSLSNAAEQVRMLTSYDSDTPTSASSNELSNMSSYDEPIQDNTSSSSSHGSMRRKSPKEQDRLQRMYCFHGHTLVISILLSHEKTLPTGFPKNLILELFEFGLTLLKQDVLAAPASQRHVACSIVRAGSLIVSSCLYLGYNMNRSKLIELLSCCDMLIKMSNTSTATLDDELLFELMTMEGALVCISTMLCYCPDALYYESICLELIIDDLDIAYRTIKSKYQPKFRTHFRFRTLHVILLECYAWLPPASFSSSCQLIFVEALRMFRDSISSGYICSCLHEVIPSCYDLLSSTIKPMPSSSYGLNTELPYNEQTFILKLESYATPLQKKENEAVLGLYGKDTNAIPTIFNHRENWYRPLPPSSQLDIRVIDASITIIAATFSQQTTEYRIKAMQLFSQALSQSLQSNTISTSSSSSTSSIFSTNDEEKKRKDKKNFITIKNVTTAIAYIVRSLPIGFYNSSVASDDISWFELIIDRLIDLLGYISNIEIRCAASSALHSILSKLKNESSFLEAFIENLYNRIQGMIIPALEKKGESMMDYGGYLLALGGLWCQAAENSPQPIIFATKKGGMSSRDRILTCILDCLRRVDTAVLFRAHGVMALHDIINHLFSSLSSSSYHQTNMHTILATAVNTCTILDIHSSAVHTGDDYEMLHIAIIRALASLVCLCMKIVHMDGTRQDFKDVAITCCRIWDSSQDIPSHPTMKHELISYLANIMPYLYQPSSVGISYPIIAVDDIIHIINHTIAARYTLSIESISAAVDIIRILIKYDCDAVIQGGLDLGLFMLLDWIQGTLPTTMSQSYAGLEFKSHYTPPSINTIKSSLSHTIQDTIILLIDHDISCRPHQRISYWMLFARAVGLNLRSTMNDDAVVDSTSPSDRNHEDEGRHHDDTSSSSSSANISSSTSSGHVSSYQQFIMKFRDYIIEKAQALPPARVSIKLFAIRCANVVLHHLKHDDTIIHHVPAHIDLKLARIQLNMILSKKIIMNTATGISDHILAQSITIDHHNLSSSSSSSLSYLPIYTVLFLNDYVNLACAAASFTINDKRLLYLQYESMQVLEQLVSIYHRSYDPDVTDTSISSSEHKLMHQYVSQLLSTVRPALTETWCPGLIMSAGNIIIDFIAQGYIIDKVSVRRLIKSMLSYMDIISKTNDYHVITSHVRGSNVVSWELSIAEYLVNAMNIARLTLISADDIPSDISDTISSMIHEYIPILVPIWTAIVCDCTRIHAQQHIIRHDVSSSEIIDKADLRRGGLTFATFMNMMMLMPYYKTAYPILLSAIATTSSSVSSSSSAPVLSDVDIFTLLSSLLQECHDNVSQAIPMIESLAAFCRKVDHISTISISSWTRLLRYITSIHASSSDMKQVSFYHAYMKLSYAMMQQASSNNIHDHDAMISSLSATLLTIICYIPTIYAHDTDRQAIIDGAMPSITSTIIAADISSINTHTIPTFESTPILLQLILDSLIIASSWSSSSTTSIDADPYESIAIIRYCMEMMIAVYARITTCAFLNATIRSTIMKSIMTCISQLQHHHACISIIEDLPSYLLSQLFIIKPAEFITIASAHNQKVDVVIKAYVDGIFHAWRMMASSLPDKNRLSFPAEMITCIIDPSSDVVSMNTAYLEALLLTIQSDQLLGSILASTFLPAITTSISSSSSSSNLELISIQILFIIFTNTLMHTDDKAKAEYISYILPCLCKLFQRYPALDSSCSQLAGKGITHIARMNPEILRYAVPKLEDQQRGVLQAAMRVSMEQQQQQQSQHSSSPASASSQPAPLSTLRKFDSDHSYVFNVQL